MACGEATATPEGETISTEAVHSVPEEGPSLPQICDNNHGEIERRDWSWFLMFICSLFQGRKRLLLLRALNTAGFIDTRQCGWALSV